MGHWNVSMKRNPEVLERIKKLYKEGLTVTVIAKRVGMSWRGVHLVIKKIEEEENSCQGKV